jgi:CSLREA domain-containing protein
MFGRRFWRRPRRSLAALFVVAAALAAPEVGAATVFTVNTNDDGDLVCSAVHCSLREAINAANSSPGNDRIVFDIPPGGPQTIHPLGRPLPTVIDPATIDATTQPGFSGSPIIEIDGSTANPGADGLRFQTNDSEALGFVINRFAAGTAAIVLVGNHDLVQTSYLGLDLSGTAALPNRRGVYVLGSNNQIGGTTPAARNVISGNSEDGVLLDTGSGNVVVGNYVGTDVSGTMSRRNIWGIRVSNFGSGDTIGNGAASGRNVVSGNFNGIEVDGPSNVVKGNYIGPDPSGNAPNGNENFGMNVAGSDNTIGGTVPGTGNVISGNLKEGFQIQSPGTRNVFVGNIVGLNATGDAALGNGFGFRGVIVNNASGNRIGGPGNGERNIISANHTGIWVIGNDNLVQGNYIGTDITGTKAFGNRDEAVLIGPGSRNLIGGRAAGEGNLIAYNGAGVSVFGTTSVQNGILSNSIFANDSGNGMGIDIGHDGPTPNDPGDADVGANEYQNYPVLTSVSHSGGQTTVDGTLDSHPLTRYLLQFFRNDVCDQPYQHGEGQDLIAERFVTTDAAGIATFSFNVGGGSQADVITATATDPSNNTSEFSNCSQEPAPPAGSTTTLSPPTATNEVDTDHTVTATATTPAGAPLAGTVVHFTVTGSVSTTGTCTTNASGQCSFTYHGPQLPGGDVITAYADVNGNQQQDAIEVSGTASKTWVLTGSTTTLSPPTDTNEVDTDHTVTATVTTPGGVRVPGTTVHFTVSGSVSTTGTCTTDANGQCSFTYHGPSLPGADTITAYADVNGNQQQDPAEVPGTATKAWILSASVTTLSPPDAVNPVDTDHTVTATVTTPGGVRVPGTTVRFTVSGSVSTTGTCTTDANGQCSFTYHGPSLPGADLITAYADVNGNDQQEPTEVSGAATKEWILPASTPGQVTGGGKAPALLGEIAFGFNAQNLNSGVKGNCNSVEKDTRTHFKCVTVDTLVVTATHAWFAGQATVDGVATNYRIDVDDLDEPGTGRDTFRVTTTSGYTAGGVLTSGNIQIHN